MQVRQWLKRFKVTAASQIDFEGFCQWFKADAIGNLHPSLVTTQVNRCEQSVAGIAQTRDRKVKQMREDRELLKVIDKEIAIVKEQARKMQKKAAGLEDKKRERDELKRLIAQLEGDQKKLMAVQLAARPTPTKEKQIRKLDFAPSRPNYIRSQRTKARGADRNGRRVVLTTKAAVGKTAVRL